jgi:hypothetical protein
MRRFGGAGRLLTYLSVCVSEDRQKSNAWCSYDVQLRPCDSKHSTNQIIEQQIHQYFALVRADEHFTRGRAKRDGSAHVFN